MKLKPYFEYKDSSRPWLGNIPVHWDLVPAFAAFKERKEINRGLLESQVLSLSYGRIIKKKEDALHGLVPASFETYQIVEPGNLILRLTDLQNDQRSLRVGLVKDRGIITSAYVCISPCKPLLPAFAYYFLHAADVQKVFYSMGSGLRQSMGFADLKHLPISIPDFEEQKQIVRFLDAHGREVDRFIRTKRRLIELLSEQKASIINQAVTQGLDPDIPMKASGNVWLGEIPAQWETKKLGQICSKIADGPHFSPDYVDQGIIFLSARNIKTDRWALGDVKYISIEDYQEFCKRIKPEIGDVLYTKGGTTGVARVVDLESPFNVWVHVAVLKIKRELANPYYVAYALNSAFCYQQSQLYTRGATNKDLGLTRMVNIVLPLPGLIKQEMIVSSVDKQISAINETISKAEREVGLIKEYRTTLIADVVTGKLDVRDVKLSELEEVGNLTSRDNEMIDDALEETGELEMIKAGTDADD